MKLKDMEQVTDLQRDLEIADKVLAELRAEHGETVKCFARFGRAYRPHCEVEMLPVPRSMVVSAAERDRAKIIDKLAQLGVTVEDWRHEEARQEDAAEPETGQARDAHQDAEQGPLHAPHARRRHADGRAADGAQERAPSHVIFPSQRARRRW